MATDAFSRGPAFPNSTNTFTGTTLGRRDFSQPQSAPASASLNSSFESAHTTPSRNQSAPPADETTYSAGDAPRFATATEAEPATAQPKPIVVPEINKGLTLKRRPAEVRRIAVEVFPQTDSWVVFYRTILGADGVARKLFKGTDQFRFWESSPEFLEIQEMVTALRAVDSKKSDSVEPLRMITIRLPVSLHEALKAEASDHATSMNKLCLSKLIMSISPKLVPPEKGRIRGRKPGPQGKRKSTSEE
jgi:hypothetical protein